MSSLSSTPSPALSLTISYASNSFTTSSLFSSSTPSTSSTSATPTYTSSSTSSLTYPTSSTTTTSTPAVSSTSSTSTSLAVDQPSSSVASTTTTDAGVLTSVAVSTTLALTSGSPTPSSSTHSSSSDFFSNTGAVAGTFTVVGLVGVALVAALVMFIIKRHARAYEEDAEFLDKNPDFSDPPMNRVTSMDDISSSDHTHYGAPPMALPPPPVFYPDYAAPDSQAFQAESFPQPPSRGYSAGYTQQHPGQYIYTPEDYDIAYPPVAPHGNFDPHGFAGVQVEPAPAPRAQAVLADILRPPTKQTLAVPAQRADSRFSVDSFYTGIAQDSAAPTGQAF